MIADRCSMAARAGLAPLRSASGVVLVGRLDELLDQVREVLFRVADPLLFQHRDGARIGSFVDIGQPDDVADDNHRLERANNDRQR